MASPEDIAAGPVASGPGGLPTVAVWRAAVVNGRICDQGDFPVDAALRSGGAGSCSRSSVVVSTGLRIRSGAGAPTWLSRSRFHGTAGTRGERRRGRGAPLGLGCRCAAQAHPGLPPPAGGPDGQPARGRPDPDRLRAGHPLRGRPRGHTVRDSEAACGDAVALLDRRSRRRCGHRPFRPTAGAGRGVRFPGPAGRLGGGGGARRVPAPGVRVRAGAAVVLAVRARRQGRGASQHRRAERPGNRERGVVDSGRCGGVRRRRGRIDLRGGGPLAGCRARRGVLRNGGGGVRRPAPHRWWRLRREHRQRDPPGVPGAGRRPGLHRALGAGAPSAAGGGGQPDAAGRRFHPARAGGRRPVLDGGPRIRPRTGGDRRRSVRRHLGGTRARGAFPPPVAAAADLRGGCRGGRGGCRGHCAGAPGHRGRLRGLRVPGPEGAHRCAGAGVHTRPGPGQGLLGVRPALQRVVHSRGPGAGAAVVAGPGVLAAVASLGGLRGGGCGSRGTVTGVAIRGLRQRRGVRRKRCAAAAGAPAGRVGRLRGRGSPAGPGVPGHGPVGTGVRRVRAAAGPRGAGARRPGRGRAGLRRRGGVLPRRLPLAGAHRGTIRGAAGGAVRGALDPLGVAGFPAAARAADRGCGPRRGARRAQCLDPCGVPAVMGGPGRPLGTARCGAVVHPTARCICFGRGHLADRLPAGSGQRGGVRGPGSASTHVCASRGGGGRRRAGGCDVPPRSAPPSAGAPARFAHDHGGWRPDRAGPRRGRAFRHTRGDDRGTPRRRRRPRRVGREQRRFRPRGPAGGTGAAGVAVRGRGGADPGQRRRQARRGRHLQELGPRGLLGRGRPLRQATSGALRGVHTGSVAPRVDGRGDRRRG